MKHRGVRTDGDDQNHTTPREQYESANLQWDIGKKQARALWTGLGSWVSDWLSADAWAEVRLMVLWSIHTSVWHGSAWSNSVLHPWRSEIVEADFESCFLMLCLVV